MEIWSDEIEAKVKELGEAYLEGAQRVGWAGGTFFCFSRGEGS